MQNKVLFFINFLRKIEDYCKSVYRCGISIIPNPDEYGNLGFIFLGRSLKQHQYAEDFIDALLDFDIKDWELEILLRQSKRV